MDELGKLPPQFKNFKVPFGPIGETVFRRTYSHKMSDGRWEEWPDTVVRTVDGNIGLVDPKYIEEDERLKLIELLLPFGILPAGRHLNASGVKGRQFLFNCLSGETLVQTRQGLIPIRELPSFDSVEILSMVERTKSGIGCWSTPSIGVWRKASFKSFGSQKLYEVVFSDGSSVRATADHKWYVSKRSEPVETLKLVGHDVPFVAPPKPERNEQYEKGILHGFVYGDGTVSRAGGNTYSAHVQMFAEKDLDLVPLFKKHGYEASYPHYCKAYIGRLPSEWKSLPPDDASRSYWHGFICGLLAADGTVDRSGSVYIYQSDKDGLEILNKKAQEVGFVTSPLYLQRKDNPWTGEPAACWRLNLRRFSVNEEDLVLSHHRINFMEAGESKISSMKVLEVRDLNIEEEVYCGIEPETHTFVIGNNILTGNCHGSGWDAKEPSAHFSFLFDQLMQGGGVGANYSNRYLHKLPKVESSIDLHIICRTDHPNHSEFADLLQWPHDGQEKSDILLVEDSREGWVDVVEKLMVQAFSSVFLNEHQITIDVSAIREKGAPLKTSGGIACGPGPLVSMLHDLVKQLNGCIGRSLTSLDSMQLDHILAGCVVAGGKRRSSRMSVKNWEDFDIFEFINCKREDGAHWTTNISVEVDDAFFLAYSKGQSHARAVMRAIVLGKRLNGEPGIWNRSLAMIGEADPEAMYCPNPCGEIGLHMWENCCLGHVNLEYFAKRGKPAMMEAFRLMTRYLYRATFGDIPQKRQREVVNKNRRIGVGFFGFHAYLALNGIKYSECAEDGRIRKMLVQARKVVSEEAARYANEMSKPVPVANTALAPTGSTAGGLVGTTTSGQCMLPAWFKRLVRFSSMDPELEVQKKEGYEVFIDPDAKNTEIVTYWCEDPLVGKVRAAGFDPAEILENQYEISFETSLKVHGH